MLEIINNSLEQTLKFGSRKFTQIDRLNYFLELNQKEFTRKDYMSIFKDISSATASRDLRVCYEISSPN